MSDGGKGALAHPVGRCPSRSPDSGLKCLEEKGHKGVCHGKRRSGELIAWSYRATPEETDRKEEGKEVADLVSDRILKDVMHDVE